MCASGCFVWRSKPSVVEAPLPVACLFAALKRLPHVLAIGRSGKTSAAKTPVAASALSEPALPPTARSSVSMGAATAAAAPEAPAAAVACARPPCRALIAARLPVAAQDWRRPAPGVEELGGSRTRARAAGLMTGALEGLQGAHPRLARGCMRSRGSGDGAARSECCGEGEGSAWAPLKCGR